MRDRGMLLGLVVGGLALFVLSFTPTLVWDGAALARVALAMTVPPLLLIAVHVFQTLRGHPPSLAPAPLLLGVWMMVFAALSWSTPLWFAAPLLAVLATPVLAYSWVQPGDKEQFWVGIVGTALGLAVVWAVGSCFVGLTAAASSGVLVAVLVAGLELLRRRAANARA